MTDVQEPEPIREQLTVQQEPKSRPPRRSRMPADGAQVVETTGLPENSTPPSVSLSTPSPPPPSSPRAASPDLAATWEPATNAAGFPSGKSVALSGGLTPKAPPAGPVYEDYRAGRRFRGGTRTVRAGSAGDDVLKLQRILNVALDQDILWVDLVRDGKFGPATEAAVRQLQDLIGLPETGVVDLDMWRSLRVVT